jgi:hypothetical protein
MLDSLVRKSYQKLGLGMYLQGLICLSMPGVMRFEWIANAESDALYEKYGCTRHPHTYVLFGRDPFPAARST